MSVCALGFPVCEYFRLRECSRHDRKKRKDDACNKYIYSCGLWILTLRSVLASVNLILHLIIIALSNITRNHRTQLLFHCEDDFSKQITAKWFIPLCLKKKWRKKDIRSYARCSVASSITCFAWLISKMTSN